MALITLRRPKNEITRLHDEMNDLFNAFFGGMEKPAENMPLWPAIDIAEDEDSVHVNAEVPGCKAKDLDISVHGNMLTIKGEKKHTEEKKEKGYYHEETSYGQFRRDIRLPSEVDQDKIEAACKDGVLSIKMPKLQVTKPVKVEIKEG